MICAIMTATKVI